MLHMRIFRHSATAVFLTLFISLNVSGQSEPLKIDYTVAVASVDEQLFHVTVDISNIRQQSVTLSLPVWTPGWYTIENYAKNILRFKVADSTGKRIQHSMIGKQTWKVPTEGFRSIKVEFDYHATVLALNQAKISEDLAFFTGTQLFLLADGHRTRPATVKIQVPAGWKVNSSLNASSEGNVFVAPDYDTLVDSTTIAGRFDETRFDFEGKPHYLIGWPSGAFSKENTETLREMLVKIAQTQKAIFGDLPYNKYQYIYFFARPESNAGGALEHVNSHVGFAGPFGSPKIIANVAAHEFFHVWNVKLIRPAEMWPYQYQHENETPLLWVSEGFTNYFAELTMLRSGLNSREEFLAGVARSATQVENNEARHYISPADSSTSTWLGYDTPVAFGISYYDQGQNLGALLDLSILNDTAGRSRLDDVMRTLYREYYKKNKGFSSSDVLTVINRISGRDYKDFFRRYVTGVEVPDYSAFLAYAGYKAEKNVRQIATVGLSVGVTASGEIEVLGVSPGSAGAAAGIQRGDILKTIDGTEVRRRLRGINLDTKIGQSVKVEMKRNGVDQTLSMKVGSIERTNFRVETLANPTSGQLAIREAWLKAR